ncbi:diguanylate phosphodiesterase [Clostridia bacterium]|nr:diguanylate phosphodiesterase [Clostridia bacterium]
MKTTKILAALLAAALTVSLSACSQPAEKTAAELRFGVTTEPDSLDPYAAVGGDTKGLLFNVYEGLVKPDSDGNMLPAIAESWEVLDGAKTYLFTLRKNVRFHNGTPVTIEDVLYSFERGNAAALPELSNISGITNEDGKLKITLTDADTEFLAGMTNAVIPKDSLLLSSYIPGTGPFRIDGYTPQQSLTLVKNADYWGAAAKLDKVTVLIEADTNAVLLSLQSGNLDGAAIATSAAQQLNLNDFNILERNSNAVQLVALNNAYAPFGDVRVRRAINYAVSRQEIIDKAFFGYGTPVGTPIIPGFKTYFNADLTGAYPYALDSAKRLLADAGYADGFPLEITVPSNYTVHVDTAQVLVSQLEKIGVSATIKQVDWPTWLSETYAGRDYQATVISVGGASLSPKAELSRYQSAAAGNFINFASPDFDAKYAAASSELDDGTRVTLYKEAQAILSDEAASVFVQDIAGLTALAKSFDGLTSYPVYGVNDFSTIYKVK